MSLKKRIWDLESLVAAGAMGAAGVALASQTEMGSYALNQAIDAASDISMNISNIAQSAGNHTNRLFEQHPLAGFGAIAAGYMLASNALYSWVKYNVERKIEHKKAFPIARTVLGYAQDTAAFAGNTTGFIARLGTRSALTPLYMIRDAISSGAKELRFRREYNRRKKQGTLTPLTQERQNELARRLEHFQEPNFVDRHGSPIIDIFETYGAEYDMIVRRALSRLPYVDMKGATDHFRRDMPNLDISPALTYESSLA